MARIDPTPEQWRLLGQGFSSAFVDVPSLENLLQLEAGENPSDIISNRVNRQTAIREVLQWAVAGEQLDKLLIRARNVKPTNTVLRKAAEAFNLAPSSTGLESLLRAGNNVAGIEDFIRSLSEAELAVCRIEMGGAAAGTGFLVGADLVFTCYHVLEPVVEGEISADQVVSRFDYKTSVASGELQAGVPYRLASAWKVDASPKNELDFVLLKLAGNAGEEIVARQIGAPRRGWLRFTEHPIKQSQSIYVIQHPLGAAMKISLGMVVSLDEVAVKICHDASTERGSSGSPCFAMDGKVIGVHQHGQDHTNLLCAGNGAVRSTGILGKPTVAGALR